MYRLPSRFVTGRCPWRHTWRQPFAPQIGIHIIDRKRDCRNWLIDPDDIGSRARHAGRTMAAGNRRWWMANRNDYRFERPAREPILARCTAEHTRWLLQPMNAAHARWEKTTRPRMRRQPSWHHVTDDRSSAADINGEVVNRTKRCLSRQSLTGAIGLGVGVGQLEWSDETFHK